MGKRANGEGSIHLRKDGRYEARFQVLMPDGTYARRSICSKLREAVATKMEEALNNSRNGIPAEATGWSVKRFLEHWLLDVKRVRKYRTYQGYESVCRNHIIPVLGKKKLHKVSVSDVKRVIKRVENVCLCCIHKKDANRTPKKRRCCAINKCCQRRPKPRLVEQVHSVLRNALTAAMREELIRRNVASLVQVASPDYDINRGLTLKQAKELFAVVKNDRFYAVYVLALRMGMRRGEILGLRWDDIDFGTGTLNIKRTLQRIDGKLRTGPPKTVRSKRALPLVGTCERELNKHKAAQQFESIVAPYWIDTGYVFTTTIGTPVEPDNLRRSWHPLREQLGLGDMTFHDARHTCVTLLLDEGVPPHIVQAIAGHADIKVTMTIYAHANLDTMRAGLKKLDKQLDEAEHG